MATSKKIKGEELEVNVEFQGFENAHAWPELAAYLYSRSGRLLATSTVTQKPGKVGFGSIRFDGMRQISTKGVTLKIGPKVETVLEVTRQKLSTHRLSRLPLVVNIPRVTILQPVWICWVTKPYQVTGMVEKWDRGKRYPVCLGEVDIYEVDVHCLSKLPDPVIERLRDGIIDLVLDPPPFDIRQQEQPLQWWDLDSDWCAAPPRPRPPSIENLRAKVAQLPPQWSFAGDRAAAMNTARKRLDQQLAAMAFSEKRQWLSSTISEQVRFSEIVYSSTRQFRDLLVDRFQAFRFWLCWYPWMHWLWWPWCRYYGLEKLGTAQLQLDGSFSEMVPLSVCHKDHPDLWFKVRQALEGGERVIYGRYPVLCHTEWNHPSGKPVNLLTHDAQAVVCEPGKDPDKTGIYVMPLGIGDDGWYEIEQAHLKPGDIPGSDRGLFDASDPYGTRLDLRMQFHDGLTSAGVAYYRWSVSEEGGSSWSYLNTPITHRYLSRIGSDFFIVPEVLGPFAVAGAPCLFKVPDPAKDWVALNRNDRTFAHWYTSRWDSEQNRYVAQTPDGRYVLRLEMFDAAGNRLNPTNPGTAWSYFLPSSDPATGIQPVDDKPHVQPDGSVHFNLWVDNSATTADIRSIGLGGSPIGDCQFIEYENGAADQVKANFVAYHKQPPERDFLAGYRLSIKRGAAGTTVVSHSDKIPVQAPASLDTVVDSLLRQVGSDGGCAFAVELRAFPRTRDGFTRIRQYESRDSSAFTLMKRALPSLQLSL